ncbi:hypothetical protein ALC62_12663, partial [Cyphomyrmex costatus]
RLEFLDVPLIKRDNRLIFDWLHKPTFSGRFLNFLSNHPLSQKRGTVFSLVDRAFFLSDICFHYKNFKFIINILLDNDYSLNFIFDTINQRLKYLVKNKFIVNDRPTNTQNNSRSVSWLTVPFVPGITEKFNRLNSSHLRVSYYSSNKLHEFIRVHKDPLPREKKSGVVYKISCKNCDASYVGQTCRQLKSRIAEHKNHIRWNTSTRSVITEPRLHEDHEFDWENVRILDDEPHYRKRLISEMISIRRQVQGLNLQTDMEGFPKVYFPIIDRI